MSNSFNKGEWSEFYAFLKILTDRKVYAADENLKKKEDTFFPILKILNNEKSNSKVYDISDNNDIKVITLSNDGDKEYLVPYEKITPNVKKIFEQILNAKGASFEIPETKEIICLLDYNKIKAHSSNKADINVVIHDYITQRNSKVGFSIKSNIGSSPTLLNASRSTNFIYHVTDLSIDHKHINLIEGRSKIRRRIGEIKLYGGKLNFSKLSSTIFEKNIRKIDSFMPKILSEFLMLYFTSDARTIVDLTKLVACSNNMKELNFDYDDIKFKIKYLLLNIALGMVPSTPWDGFLKADGGYIIVKEDGDIVCYHIYNIAEFSEYLFNTTKLDTPSTTRHDFGSIYQEELQFFLNLNIQIRFT